MSANSPQPPTNNSWLTSATAQLTAANIPSARLDAELLLSHTLRKPRTWLHAHGDEELSLRHKEIANARLDLRLDRVPVAYIIGHKEFYGRSFKVTTATLIPRPESEDLIALLKDIIPHTAQAEKPLKLVDVGTGSGNLGITAKLEYPQLDVTLLDISRHALTVAEENAADLHAPVTVLKSDLLTSYPYTADIIIANLPYVDRRWIRSPETNHEPASALFAEDGGLALIFELLRQTKDKLASGGSILLEADPTQHTRITQEAAQYGLILSHTVGYGVVFNKVV